MKQYVPIISLGNGWYNFEAVPQDMNYIKIHNMRCLTDKLAIKQALKINPDYKYHVVRKEEK